MSLSTIDLGPSTPPVDDCWNRIGVNGDQSCPKLAEYTHCRNCPVFSEAARTFFDRKAPDGYLSEWSDLLGRPSETGQGMTDRLLVFRLGSEWLAVDLRYVAEVTTPRPVHRVPHRTNQVFSGLVSLRGQLQLCVSLHGLLNVASRNPDEDPAANLRLVLIRDGKGHWAFPAEEVAGVHHLRAGELQKVPSTLANPDGSFSRAVFGWEGGRSVDVLDEPRVFAVLGRLGV